MDPRPQRKPTRLPFFNYNEAGTYFLTLCAKDKRCILGRVLDGADETQSPTMQLSRTGIIVQNQIQTMVDFYSNVKIDRFVVMPNHIHLLLSIRGDKKETTLTNAIIPSFVSTLKRFTNKQAGADLWQRSFHDHIVRNEQDYLRIWQYIDSNAAKWKMDCFYTA